MSNRSIGIFDSGTGGLTVMKAMIEKMPDENMVYFGDTAHLPYGTKSEKQILRYVNNDLTFLSQFDLKAVVIACNTADAVAREKVEANYPFPIYGVVNPAAAEAVNVSKNKKVGVIATNATVNSNAYVKQIEEIDSSISVYQMACPLLVPLVEQGRVSKDDPEVISILSEYLNPLLKQDIDTLILGCTHYPLLVEPIKAIVGEQVSIISSSSALANHLYSSFKEKGLLEHQDNPQRHYYVSDKSIGFEDKIRLFLSDDFDDEVQEVTL